MNECERLNGDANVQVLLDLAMERNEQPLPLIGERFGVRLPPEKYCLTQPCYQLETPPSSASVTAAASKKRSS